jgi:PKD repeat protein
VMVKTGTAAGVAGSIHAFATKGGGSAGVPSALYLSITGAKMNSPDGTDAGGGTFHYPLNPVQDATDYNGNGKAALSKSAALNWGFGFGQPNIDYIQSLRTAVLPAPTNLTATVAGTSITLRWAQTATDETGFEIARSLDGTTYTTVATVDADSTTFSDSCLDYATRYYYKVRTVSSDLASAYTPVTPATTASRPAIVLPALAGGCAVTAVAPTAPDNCGAPVTATTSDPTTYDAQGTYTLHWNFAFADGTVAEVPQQVLVKDSVAPQVPELATVTGQCAATLTPPTALDDCAGTVAGSTTDALTYSTQGSFVVHWTFDDGHGNVSIAAQSVVVHDDTAPTVLTRDLTVTLANGSATIQAADIDQGTNDACGLAALTLDRTVFDCSNLGRNSVILTATDVNGNRSTAQATVTVLGAVPAPAIAISRLDNTATGLPATTIALGYGSQRLVLTASNGTSASGATAYAWAPATGLSNTIGANATFTPTAPGTYTFTLTATNEFGCTASTSVVLTVMDVRCGNKNDKVTVCHKGQENCISPNAVAAHLGHGDQLGGCASIAARDTSATPPAQAEATVFKAYPNPFAGRATVQFQPAATGPAQVQLFNALGQPVATLYDGTAEAGRYYELTLDGTALPAGIYTCRLLSNGVTQTQRMVLLK